MAKPQYSMLERIVFGRKMKTEILLHSKDEINKLRIAILHTFAYMMLF
jgi:hypothetical protein